MRLVKLPVLKLSVIEKLDQVSFCLFQGEISAVKTAVEHGVDVVSQRVGYRITRHSKTWSQVLSPNC